MNLESRDCRPLWTVAGCVCIVFESACLKRLLARLQVVRADLHSTGVKLRWDDQTEAVSPEALVGWVAAHSQRARLLPPSTLEYSYVPEKELAENLDEAVDTLSGLLENNDSHTDK